MKNLDSCNNNSNINGSGPKVASTTTKVKDVNVVVVPNNQASLTKNTVRPIPPEQFKSNILKGELPLNFTYSLAVLVFVCMIMLYI